MYEYQNEVSYDQMYRQQPTVQYLPPVVIERYLNQWITTSIPGYGQVVAYVLDYNRQTGMVSLFIYPSPRFQQQFIQVHHSDLVGISPYFGPTPPTQPTPPRPPRPRPPFSPHPWFPGYGPGYPSYPGYPGYGPGGGFWPWLFHQAGAAIGTPPR